MFIFNERKHYTINDEISYRVESQEKKKKSHAEKRNVYSCITTDVAGVFNAFPYC